MGSWNIISNFLKIFVYKISAICLDYFIVITLTCMINIVIIYFLDILCHYGEGSLGDALIHITHIPEKMSPLQWLYNVINVQCMYDNII